MVDTSRFGTPDTPKKSVDTSRFGAPDTSRFGTPKESSSLDTLKDIGVGFGTGIAEPVLGAAELMPGAIGRGAAGLSKDLEAAYQESARRSPIATRVGYVPGMAATALAPVGAGLKLAKGANLLTKALAGGAGAGTGAFALTPTGKEDYSERIGEKAAAVPLATALGAGLPAVPGVYKAGKKFLGTGFDAVTGKVAREAEAAATGLKEAIPQVGEAGKQAIGQRAKELTTAETQKRARQEANLKAAETKATGEAQAQRESIAQRYSDLGKPANPADLGDEMQRRITGTESTRTSRRAQQAEKDFGDYFKQAEGFETSKPREAMIARLKAMTESASVGSPGRKYAAEALNNLQKSTNAKGAEIEFRKYFQEASAPQQMGFGAEEQNAVRKVSDIISEALDTHAPKRIEARNTYKEFSTPLDAYETQFGKKAVKEEAGVQGRLQMKPSDYPNTYFKDRDTVRNLREQLAGDEAAVRKFANQHAVNELQGKTAAQAETWLKSNQKWLDEVPGLNERVNKYVEELGRAEAGAATKEAQAAKLGAKKGEVISARQKAESNIAESAKTQTQNIEDQVRNLSTLAPEQISGAADKLVKTLGTMRDVNGKPIVDQKTLDGLIQQMNMVDNAYGASKKAGELKRAIIIKGLSAAGVGSGVYAGAKYLGG
jgi:hypothetical protein